MRSSCLPQLTVIRIFALTALLALSGCARISAPGLPSRLPESSGEAVVARALDLVGTPYRAGGSSPATGFDCSGLVHYVYRDAAGIELPRTSAELGALRTPAPAASALRPGDLVLFSVKRGSRIDHTGIYVGDGDFVHAPSSGGRVRVEPLSERYWQRSYRGARRILD